IFFTIPRISAGFYQKGFGDNIRTSGFSETVNLGAIGPIKRDPSVVMRVEVPRQAPHPMDRLYMRGVAFDQYDGKSWTNRLSYRRNLSEENPGTFIIRGHQAPTPSRLGDTIQQNILLESLDTSVLFAAPFVEQVNGKFPAVQSDFMGSVYLPFPSSSRIEYAVVSRSHPVLPADLGSEPRRTQNRSSNISCKFPINRSGSVRSQRTLHTLTPVPMKKRRPFKTFLTRNYRYSLDAPLAGVDRPLEEFLFLRKTGYCEHYATAMVIMLRMVGIPARLVTGFLATEWNEYGSYYVVRQQDAHAWVEVHLPRSGWVTMDPTPPSGEAVEDVVPAWRVVERILDNVKLQWSRFFVQYSAADQLAVVRELKAGGQSVGHRALDSMAVILGPIMRLLGGIPEYVFPGTIRPQGAIWGLIAVGCLMLLWLSVRRILAGVHTDRKTTPKEQPIVDLYGQMIKRLAAQGITKQLPLHLLSLFTSHAGDGVKQIPPWSPSQTSIAELALVE
ncbi:MAG: DUF3488 domain-containing transglutaminase family protein, partial [Nitrospira sp.]|nr:DUF3488 domain-containing transglutaminase family protein [Nitrospira sp.]